jgi:general secretion pathway protein D
MITNERKIDTTVIVEDGGILVLGGLIEDTLRESTQKVPILGSIPLLGALFRHRSVDKVKVNLMVFIRPTILRDGTEATNATHAKYNYTRDLLMGRGTNVPQMIGEERPTIPPLESYEEQKKALDSATDDSGD